MRFLMVDRLENSPSTFWQGECHHHRHSKWGSEYRGKSRFRLSPFRRAGFQPSLHRECASGPAESISGRPPGRTSTTGAVPAVRRPPRVRLIDTVRHRQPMESRKAWFWVSSVNNPKTLGLLFPRPQKQFLTS